MMKSRSAYLAGLLVLIVGLVSLTTGSAVAGNSTTLSNHDVYNTCATPANGFALFLEGIAPADVTEVYNGNNNVFGYPGGIVDSAGPGVTVITWIPDDPSILVMPGAISHFGYGLTEGAEQDLTGESFLWLFNSNALCQTPGIVAGWHPGGDDIDISNPNSSALQVRRLHATSTSSLTLADLLPGTTIVQSAVDVLGNPGGTTLLTPGSDVDFDFPTVTNAVDRMLVVNVADSNGNAQVTSYFARPTVE